MRRALYSGAGNTFLLVDNREEAPLPPVPEELDGLLSVEPSREADFKAHILNRDGSEAEMCGNGLRCFIAFLERDLALPKRRWRIETLAGTYTAWSEGDEVCVEMLPPSEIRWEVAENLHFLNTGVPHVVRFVPSVKEVDVEGEGRELRNSPLFAPAGTNVNFVALQEDGTLKIRTYERGVEAETLACGTGATASALAASHLFHLPSPIKIHVQSGDVLTLSLIDRPVMRGPVLSY